MNVEKISIGTTRMWDGRRSQNDGDAVDAANTVALHACVDHRNMATPASTSAPPCALGEMLKEMMSQHYER